jgi:hypothetical protein
MRELKSASIQESGNGNHDAPLQVVTLLLDRGLASTCSH